MKAIGFRADPRGVTWAVVQGPQSSPTLVAHGYIAVPESYASEAEGLAHIRQWTIDVLAQHVVQRAGVRYPEANRQAANITSTDSRIRVEGVILEACASRNVPVGGGSIRTIGALMGSDKPKGYLKADEVRGLKFPNKSANCKEAIVVAVSALEGE